jgi:hypothetical protein
MLVTLYRIGARKEKLMSGIINSAGSRSGIINTTELDYEEGEWEAGCTSSGNLSVVTTRTGTYTKVGRLVNVQAYLNAIDMSAASGDLRVTGLPFVPRIDYNVVSGFSSHTMDFSTAELYSIYTVASGSFLTWRYSRSGVSWGNWAATTATIYLQFSVIYEAA